MFSKFGILNTSARYAKEITEFGCMKRRSRIYPFYAEISHLNLEVEKP
jgi:hypothetical protein